MATRRDFMKGVATVSGLSAPKPESRNSGTSIAIYQDPDLAEWASGWSGEWPNPHETARYYIERAVGALPDVDSTSVEYRGVLDVGEPETMQSAWRRVKRSDTADADVTLLLTHGGRDKYEYAGWGGDGAAVVWCGEYLSWHFTYPDMGIGYEHFAVSNVLHEVGHALGLDHNDGQIYATDEIVTSTPMLSGYVRDLVDVDDREVRYLHQYEVD